MSSTSEDKLTKEQQEGKTIIAKKMGYCKCIFWTFSVLVGILACLIGSVYIYMRRSEIPEEIAINLGDSGVQTFRAFDRNDDGYISIQEFEPMYHHLVNGGHANFTSDDDIQYDQELTFADEIVTVVPSFKPLELTSMMRDLDRHKGAGAAGSPDPLYGLKSWKSANKEFLNFAVHHFDVFLPKDHSFDIGKVYYIVEDEQSFFQTMVSDISSNRYFPPSVKTEYVTLHRLLTIFHPRPFLQSRFKPRGSVATVRAKNDKYIEIVFRIHAEFQLNQLPNFPFWFTPAQFTGRLILTQDLKHIVHFNMYVPNNKKLNVDMEWLEGGNNMVVDIGYLPEMSLKITAPSVPGHSVVLEEMISEKKFDVDDISWSDEISEEEALRNLQKEMYPFQKVRYYNFTESLDIANKENKMMHHILLWGALDDQSC